MEDNDKRQAAKSALEASKKPRTIAEIKREVEEEEAMILREKELEQERAYRRMEYWDNTSREEGVSGKKAGGVIPAVQNNDSGNSSGGGAVSGTDSESDSQAGKTIKGLSAVKWIPRMESDLEEMLVRNQFDFKAVAKEF